MTTAGQPRGPLRPLTAGERVLIARMEAHNPAMAPLVRDWLRLPAGVLDWTLTLGEALDALHAQLPGLTCAELVPLLPPEIEAEWHTFSELYPDHWRQLQRRR